MCVTSHCLTGFAGVALALVAASCGTGGGSAPAPERVLHEWHDDGGPGAVSVRICLADQIAEFERGGRDIGWCYVATGKEGHGTGTGTYRIMEKIVDKYSSHYGWIEDEFGNVVNGDASPGDRVPKGMVYVPAPMPYWMRLTAQGIGMHGGLIPEPGKPASHGCIRMPKDFAPVLFDAVEIGTPVTITGGMSRRASLMESQPPPQWGEERRVIATRPLSGADLQGTRAVPETRVMPPLKAY